MWPTQIKKNCETAVMRSGPIVFSMDYVETVTIIEHYNCIKLSKWEPVAIFGKATNSTTRKYFLLVIPVYKPHSYLFLSFFWTREPNCIECFKFSLRHDAYKLDKSFTGEQTRTGPWNIHHECYRGESFKLRFCQAPTNWHRVYYYGLVLYPVVRLNVCYIEVYTYSTSKQKYYENNFIFEYKDDSA